MNEEINLLTKGSGEDTLEQRAEKYVRFLAIGALSFLCFSGIIVLFFKSQSPYYALQQQETQALANLSKLSDRQAKLLLIHERIKELNDISSKKIHLEDTIDEFQTLSQDANFVDNLSLNKNMANLSISSTSLSVIADFLDRLKTLAVDKKLFRQITLNSISFDPKKFSYVVTISLH